MEQRDIKLIRRQGLPIEDLSGDVHVQIYFRQLRMRKDQWLRKRQLDTKKSEVEDIYQVLAAYRYESDTYLLGWIDKPTLIRQIQKKGEKQQYWCYGARRFWTCNLSREAKDPLSLIQYLKTQA